MTAWVLLHADPNTLDLRPVHSGKLELYSSTDSGDARR